MPTAKFAVFSGLLPGEQGPLALSDTLVFTATINAIPGDLYKDEALGRIEFVQAVFIDNSLNPAKITLTMGGSQQKISCPANYQGVFPVFAPTPTIYVAQSIGAVSVPILWLNSPQPYAAWPAG